MKNWLHYGAAGVALFLAFFLVVSGGISSPAHATTNAKTLTTHGEAEITVAPDTAFLTFGVESEAATAAASLEANAVAMEKVIASIKNQGIPEKEIQTSGFSLYPNYEYVRKNNRDVRELTGYRVHNNVSIKTKQLKDLGKLIDTTVNAGANIVQNISFGIENTIALEEEALKAAVKHARSKADTLAEAAGSRVLEVLAVEEGGGYGFQPYSPDMGVMDGVSRKMALTPIEPGQLNLTTSVKVTFKIS
jgi:uncharacterized protein YggE